MMVVRLFILLLTVGFETPDKKRDIAGQWLNPAETAIMKITRKQGAYYGELVWTKVEERKDLIHREVVKSLKPAEGKKYIDGKAYIPRIDTYLKCHARVKSQELHLTVKKGFIEITKTWTRMSKGY